MRARLATLAFAGVCIATPAAAQSPCEGIAALKLPADVRIIRVTPVLASNRFTAPGIARAKPVAAAFCRVEGVIEKEIGFELWLPERQAYAGRFLGGGVGGQAGQFNYRDLTRGVQRGYASATTDAGHKASDKHWLLGDPVRAANYAHRSNHLLAVKAKAIVGAFYARPIRTALFVGCSGGGRQALTEAQRYPNDYDGILAGAPGPKTPEMSARRMWEMVQHSASAAYMPDHAWARIAAAAVAHCDAKDGVRDGVIENGGACRFEVASLACSRTSAAGCLTPEQVAIAQKIYGPLSDENGRAIDDGLLPEIRVHPQPVPEPFTPGPAYLAVALFGDGVHRDPNWDARTFRLADDLPAIDLVMDLHADDPDLRPFTRRGGRLLLYQGWADPLVAAQPTIAYYEAARAKLGKATAGKAVQLFMVPGMEHCVGGAGTDSFGGAGADATTIDPQHDLLSALESWVEQGRKPEKIIAAKLFDGRPVRTHPLCAYPKQAIYDGHGDSKRADSFTCGVPAPDPSEKRTS